MKQFPSSCRAALVIAAGLSAGRASAQLATQQITLLPGWNAVRLEVTPSNNDTDAVFGSTAVDAVWEYAKKFEPVKFISDPASIIPPSTNYLAYFPATSTARPTRDLYAVYGGTCYLVHVGGASSQTLTITGTVAVPTQAWLGNSYSLVGFTVDPTASPTFTNFFAPSAAHAAQPRYRLNNATGRWELITSAMTMRRGEAFWQYTNGESTYQGPVEFVPRIGAGLDFSTDITSLIFTLKNNTTGSANFTMDLISSAAAPAGTTLPLVAGVVPISYWKADAATKVADFLPWTSTQSRTVVASSGLDLQISIRRTAMTPFTAPAGSTALYQSIMRVRSGGMEINVPVSSDGPITVSGSKSLAAKFVGPNSPLDARHGLWVGSASITKVSEAANPTDNTTPQPTKSSASFPLIVHMDSVGVPKLLQQVYLMSRPAETAPDPARSGFTITTVPSRYVLVTDDALLGNYKGVADVDGSSVGRRISSVAFSHKIPALMTRTAGSNPFFKTTITTDYNDNLNPFVHKYHPDHDNKDALFSNTALAEGIESYTIGREVSLEFTATDPFDRTGGGFGDTETGGIYREKITGVHRNPIFVEGVFRLTFVSSVEVLNDGN